MIVYKATNQVNDKVYIGQTIGAIEERKKSHIWNTKNGCNYYFHRAIRKHGADNFEWEVIRICDSIESLNAFEQYYILYYDSMNIGYNIMKGGNNYIVSEETRKKMSISRSGKNGSMYGRRGKNSPLYGRHHSGKAKQKMSDNNCRHWLGVKGEGAPRYGKLCSEATRKKMSIAKQNMSDETKEKMRQSQLGRTVTKKTREKLRQFNLGKKLSEEHKNKMRESLLKYWEKKKEKAKNGTEIIQKY